MPSRTHTTPRASRRLAWTVALSAAVPVLLAVWGALIEPRLLAIERTTAVMPGLPPAWDGERIAVLADWQVGIQLANVGTVRRAVEHVVQAQPAAVLLAGDFVSRGRRDPARQVDLVVDLVQPLVRAGVPTFAVLGNHDWGLAAREGTDTPVAPVLRTALETAGVRVLHNEAARLAPPRRADGEPLYVVGIGAHQPRHDNPRRALETVPAGAARVVLMHNPASFEDIPAGLAPIAIAGHTHGGQIVIPIVSELYWLVWKGRARVPEAGWVAPSRGADGNRLYVTRGIGMSDLPFRINCRPELTYLTLARR